MQEYSVTQFLSQAPVVIDVRSPIEYNQGHIPQAVNLPLFSNAERSLIGTIYKAQGKQAAILEGLEIVGPRLGQVIQNVKSLGDYHTLGVHCLRGGKRSGSVGWLLSLYGWNVAVLSGGYKNFRRFALDIFARKLPFIVIGGKTGAGKTKILAELGALGQGVVNLERCARHKGSAFGFINENEQPTQEQFENDLALEIFKNWESSPIWIEDESKFIGKRFIPLPLYNQMRETWVLYVDIPRENRIETLVQSYGKANPTLLEQALQKLEKRLGGAKFKIAREALYKGDLYTTCEIALEYYDKTYEYGLSRRYNAKVIKFSFTHESAVEIALTLLEFAAKKIYFE
jgi:tRNA 2-selenouridine synthase